ncbi:unnamed protein product, partial [Musa textilis]
LDHARRPRNGLRSYHHGGDVFVGQQSSAFQIKKRAKNSGTTRKLGGAKQRDSVNCPDPLHSATDLDAWPYNKPWALRLPLKSTPQTLASTSILIVRREASSAL